MGNTASCCVSASPKLRRKAHSRLDSYQQESDLSREETGCTLQHISDRENVDGKSSSCTHSGLWSLVRSASENLPNSQFITFR